MGNHNQNITSRVANLVARHGIPLTVESNPILYAFYRESVEGYDEGTDSLPGGLTIGRFATTHVETDYGQLNIDVSMLNESAMKMSKNPEWGGASLLGGIDIGLLKDYIRRYDGRTTTSESFNYATWIQNNGDIGLYYAGYYPSKQYKENEYQFVSQLLETLDAPIDDLDIEGKIDIKEQMLSSFAALALVRFVEKSFRDSDLKRIEGIV